MSGELQDVSPCHRRVARHRTRDRRELAARGATVLWATAIRRSWPTQVSGCDEGGKALARYHVSTRFGGSAFDAISGAGRLDTGQQSGITATKSFEMKRDGGAGLRHEITGVFTCKQAALRPMSSTRAGRIGTSRRGRPTGNQEGELRGEKAGVVGFTSGGREVASRSIP